ncbi:GNAT family N-acetyltransferase [Lactobacillus xujianguonis]|nr:GNAT family N-acetyltransferase [Lactobacillus xujianguonis]
MGMKLQKNDANLQQIARLIKDAFDKDTDLTKDQVFMSRYDHSDSYGILDKNKLQSYIMVNPFPARVFTQKTKMAGIGYVSSDKTARGKGNITVLMREILKDLHQEEIPFANLASFSENFYRQYGFEDTIYQKKYVFTNKALPYLRTITDGKTITGTWSDLLVQNGAAQLYEVPMHTSDERNTMNREYWWWNRMEKYYPERNLAVYFGRVGLPQAYMFYHVKNDTFFVDEMYADAGDGIKGLLTYIKENYADCARFEILMPEESKLENFFTEQRVLEIGIKPYMMSRIVDFEKIISCMKVVNFGSYTIRVTGDELCPWNNGTWQITNDHDGYRVKKVSASADFTGTINSWTKVLLGDMILHDAIKAGEIAGDHYSKLEFVKGTVSFYDYF